MVRATRAILDAGGVDWAMQEADARLTRGLAQLDKLPLPAQAASDFISLAEKLVRRQK